MLALIAGEGALPRAVAEAQAERPLVCALEGFPPDGIAADITFRLEHLGTLLETLRGKGATQVCFCGAIRRPRMDPAAIDAATMPLVPVMMEALGRGDDGALRGAVAIFEAQGFTVLGAHEAAPSLLPEAGVPTRSRPAPGTEAEARIGARVVAEMAVADVGQACVVAGEHEIAREGPDGTDAMLARLARPIPPPTSEAVDPLSWGADVVGDALGVAADWLGGEDGRPPGARAGILYKVPKPHQDRRVDLPTIGPATAEGAVRAGLSGIVIEADGVLVLERDRVVEILDAAGLFLWVRERAA
ncbi:LpxI family protein [Rhodosalinus sp. 5P4]|uniref:LpxI family protein n=1 Tax=Rhodosalinus sp. 5P4 TaxID=3239196 RepID=UPI00352557AF